MKGRAFLSVIPMRKEPSDKAEMVNQVLFGETFDVLEKQEKWSRIKLHHDKYEGWIDNKQYAELKGKSMNENVIQKLFQRDGKLILPMGAFSKSGTKQSTTIIKTATQFLETPYLWGGRTFMGIDCSGFTQIVFRVNGIRLLRDAFQQQTQGKKIPFERCETNDLAFFSNAEGKIIHVGIIIRSKQLKVIHASGKVRIDSLTSEGILNEETKLQTHRLHSIKRISA